MGRTRILYVMSLCLFLLDAYEMAERNNELELNIEISENFTLAQTNDQ